MPAQFHHIASFVCCYFQHSHSYPLSPCSQLLLILFLALFTFLSRYLCVSVCGCSSCWLILFFSRFLNLSKPGFTTLVCFCGICFALQYNNCTFSSVFLCCIRFFYKNQFLLSFPSFLFFRLFVLFSVILLMIFFCLHVFVWVSVWLFFCVFVCGFLLFTEGTSVSEIFLLYSSKTDFSLYFLHSLAYIFSWFFLLILLCLAKRSKSYRWNWSLFCVYLLSYFSSSCYFLFENAFSQAETNPFNWLIFCLFCSLGLKIHCVDWCVWYRNYSKKGSLKNWLKNFDTCELLVCWLQTKY